MAGHLTHSVSSTLTEAPPDPTLSLQGTSVCSASAPGYHLRATSTRPLLTTKVNESASSLSQASIIPGTSVSVVGPALALRSPDEKAARSHLTEISVFLGSSPFLSHKPKRKKKSSDLRHTQRAEVRQVSGGEAADWHLPYNPNASPIPPALSLQSAGCAGAAKGQTSPGTEWSHLS